MWREIVEGRRREKVGEEVDKMLLVRKCEGEKWRGRNEVTGE